MTSPQTTEKQVAEAVIQQFDFSSDMSAGETIISVVSVVSDNQNLVGGSANLTTGSNSAGGTVAQSLVSGGTHLEKYKLTCIVTTSAGQTLETEGFMWVRNV